LFALTWVIRTFAPCELQFAVERAVSIQEVVS
jgi:hypothetical protein